MNAREPFSDATLERMLARRAHRGEPGDLRAAVFAGIESTEPRRPLWPVGWRLRSLGRSPRSQPLALAVALLLLALLAGALAVGAAWLRQQQSPAIELTPTGIELVTPPYPTGAWGHVVEDGTGTLWAVAASGVTRFDPVSGAHHTWTVADDAALGPWPTIAARAGGLWIWSDDRIVRFAGDGYAETVPAPGRPGLLDQAPDGVLWAVSESAELVHWDGTRWVPEPIVGLPSDQQLTALLAGSGGDLWTVSYGPVELSYGPVELATGAYVAHRVGGRWSIYDWVSADPGSPASLVEGTDGSLLILSMGGNRINRLHQGHWTSIDAPVGSSPGDVFMGEVSVADDGSIWTTLTGDSPGLVARYADGRWTTYGPSDGLVAAGVVDISATSAGVFLSTDRGLLRYDGGGWAPVWPDIEASPRPGASEGFVGRSGSEAWAADGDGLWHYTDGAWDGPFQPDGLEGTGVSGLPHVNGLALGDDSSLWVATDGGVAVLSDGRWSTAWDEWALSIDLAPDGSAWVGASASSGSSARIVRLTPTASGFRSDEVTCPIPAGTLAVASDGSVWIGRSTYGFGVGGEASLAHFDGATCEVIDLRSDPSTTTTVDVRSIVADPAGGVFVQAIEYPADSTLAYDSRSVTESIIRVAGGAPSVLGASTVTSYPPPSQNITIGPDGQLWWAREQGPSGGPGPVAVPGAGLARFDGERWIQVLAGVPASGPLAVTPDGTVWFGGAAGILRIQTGTEPAP